MSNQNTDDLVRAIADALLLYLDQDRPSPKEQQAIAVLREALGDEPADEE